MKKLRDMTEPELQAVLDAIGKSIQATCSIMDVEDPHFATLLFNDPEVAQYVCNCRREDVIKAMRECADRLEQKATLERVEFTEPLGATGEYPEGRLHQNDEGGITFAVSSDKKLGKVMLTFGKPVAWLGMGRNDAMNMSDALRWHASKIGE